MDLPKADDIFLAAHSIKQSSFNSSLVLPQFLLCGMSMHSPDCILPFVDVSMFPRRLTVGIILAFDH